MPERIESCSVCLLISRREPMTCQRPATLGAAVWRPGRAMGSVLCLVVMGLVFVGCAAPQKAETDAKSDVHAFEPVNPADLYQAAMKRITEPEVAEQIRQARMPGADRQFVAEVIDRHRDILNLLARASATPSVDWGYNPARTGFETLVTEQAAPVRLVSLVQLAIAHEFAHGQIDKALDHLEMGFRMAAHTAGNEFQTVVFTYQLAAGMRNHFHASAAEMVGQMTSLQRRRLTGLLTERDPTAELERLIDGERSMTHDWLLRVYDQNPERLRLVLAELDDAIEEMVDEPDGSAGPRLSDQFDDDPQAFMAGVRLLGRRLEQVRALIDQPLDQSAESLMHLRQQAEQDQGVSGVLIPSVIGAILNHHRILTQQQMLLAAVALFEGDESAFEAIRDPMGADPFQVGGLAGGGYRLVSQSILSEERPVEMQFPVAGE